MKRSYLADICTALLLMLFAYTAMSKFLDYELFVFQMRLAPLPLMITLAPVFGWLMPVIESIIAIGLLTVRFRIHALYASVFLLLIFEVYIVSMLLTGQHLPCTCGGIISKMSWKQHLLFNALFIVIGLIGSRQHKKDKSSLPMKTGQENIEGLTRA